MKPTVKLVGEDGDVFAIIGRVSKALRHAGLAKEAEEFSSKAMRSESYAAVLRLCEDYVEVE